MSLFRNLYLRLPIVAIGAVAWLAISNHCALGAFQGIAKMPMTSCHGATPTNESPVKPDHKDGVECCKVLRATLLKPSTNLLPGNIGIVGAYDFFVVLISSGQESRSIKLIERDLGPPGADSFAESVLQRSVLAHAPPSFLS